MFSLPKLQQLVLIALLIISASLRLYKLPSTYQFQGDQGRDMLVITKAWREGAWPLLGPTTSVGQYYLGPFYYYYLAPAVLLAGFDPVGPVFWEAVVGCAAVGLLYLLVGKSHSWSTATLAAFLLAIAPSVVAQSRFAWNPNPIPFFLLVVWFCAVMVAQTKKTTWYMGTIIALAIVWQLHYVTLTLASVIPLMWWWLGPLPKTISKRFSHVSLLILATSPLAVPLLPLVVSVYRRFLEGDATVSNSIDILPVELPLFARIQEFVLSSLTRLVVLPSQLAQTLFYADTIPPFTWLLTTLALIGLLKIGWQVFSPLLARHTEETPQTSRRSLWEVVGLSFIASLIGLSFLSVELEDHYVLMTFPALCILVAVGWETVFARMASWRFLATMGLCVLLALVSYAGLNSKVWIPHGMPATIIKTTAQTIEHQANQQPYNFALLADRNSRDSYEYFFYLHRSHLVTDQATDLLFVVCEEAPCRPNGQPDWNIARFEIEHPNQITYTLTQESLPIIVRGTINK